MTQQESTIRSRQSGCNWDSRGAHSSQLRRCPPVPNPVNPNAILILQEPADRNGNGTIDQTGVGPSCSRSSGVWTCVKARPPEVTVDLATLYPWYGDSKAAVQSVSMNNWYPINFYDAREGEVRDVNQGNASCAPDGVMNAVEIDVGNLSKMAQRDDSRQRGSGRPCVSKRIRFVLLGPQGHAAQSQRPTQVDPADTKTGDSGLEDSVNSGSPGR